MRELRDAMWWRCEAKAPAWLRRLPPRRQVAAALGFEPGVALVRTRGDLLLVAESALPSPDGGGSEPATAVLRGRLARAAAPDALRPAPLSGNAAPAPEADAQSALADAVAELGLAPSARTSELEPSLRGFTTFARDDGSHQVALGDESDLPFAVLRATPDGGFAASVELASIGERDCEPVCADAAATVALLAAATARGVGARAEAGGARLVLHVERDAPIEVRPLALALCGLEHAARACAGEASLLTRRPDLARRYLALDANPPSPAEGAAVAPDAGEATGE